MVLGGGRGTWVLDVSMVRATRRLPRGSFQLMVCSFFVVFCKCRRFLRVFFFFVSLLRVSSRFGKRALPR